MRTLYTTLITLFFYQVSLAQLPINMYADNTHAPFLHGVASGDPMSDRVIIWTRISPDSNETKKVYWEMAIDSLFINVVRMDSLDCDSTTDWTAKIDVTQLSPYSTYYYRFWDEYNNYSAKGRTRTASNSVIDHIRMCVVSCSSVYSGFFNAYRKIAERPDIDLVVHLGDYIYDFVDADEQVRVPTPYPSVPTNLEEWRDRHEYYLLDPDLRAARQQHPWVVIWDNHDTDKGGSTAAYLGGLQAFWEYVPIRQPDPNNIERGYRKLSFGNLIDLFMVDVLLYRDVDTVSGNNLSILGNTQYNWLANELQNSTAKWKIIGNQKMVAGWSLASIPGWIGIGSNGVLDPKTWDGYDAARDRLLDFIENNSIDNVIILSGDSHVSMVTDLDQNPSNSSSYNENTGAGAVGVEF
ncbi:MAG: alkaline phosphatase D family protein, partial [Saprospiraceae bacterium]|nr:alkaline phosphatase D family protein [Saprospiraceae bacterium]